ncbi:uncharacterized protein [Parasteatoda tepidariorum]|uniref:uncharacterized protein isoform X2 n=1 Tax=Parasteatoda tepidariorum TaxID=114398 RepID=UPI000A2C05B8
MLVIGNYTMRIVRLRLGILVGIVFLIFLIFQVRLSIWNHSYEQIPVSDEEMELACRHPELELANPLILAHIHDVGELKCSKESDWVYIEGNLIKFNQSIVKKRGKIKCELHYVLRVDEYNTAKSKAVHLASDTGRVFLEHDFFHIKCSSQDGKHWKNLMAGIAKDKAAVKRAKAAKPPPNWMNLNVFMFGLDSMSRLHFMRKLPKTYKYLTEVLKASVLKGYNIVGDGTPQAIIPILTGFAEPELPETRKRMSNAQHVNVYPFAWKNFSANGYVTAYGEDGPSTGTFNYRLKGFKEPPTDHYLRSFYLEVDKVWKDHAKFCLGDKPRHVIMTQWLKTFYDTYTEVPKFGFVFHSELSHDDYNLVQHADGDLEYFLKGLQSSGILNSSLLIVFTDHGNRFSAIRETQQGKQEERLPFFSITVPSWVEKQYPKMVKNLKINENRLVTPFDIYSTLMTILDPDIPEEGDISSRSISVFSEIPQERTCSMANIEPHWCACLSWVRVSLEDPVVNEVGKAVIDYMNKLTEVQRDKCEILHLKEVTRIEKLQPNKALLKFKKNADKDGFVGEFSDDTKLTEVVYQVQLRASPSNGIFEASLMHSKTKNLFSIKEHELSRINMYGNQEHCIHDTYPELRKYCYCKVQL